MTVFTDHTGLCLRILSHVFQYVKIDVRRRIPPPPAPAMIAGGGGTPHMKGVGMLVVSLREVNFRFRSRLGCSGQNAIIFSREGLV